MVRLYKNGEKVLESCVFCGANFDEAQPIGKKIECPDEIDGGCGNHYRVSMYDKTSIKPDSESE